MLLLEQAKKRLYSKAILPRTKIWRAQQLENENVPANKFNSRSRGIVEGRPYCTYTQIKGNHTKKNSSILQARSLTISRCPNILKIRILFSHPKSCAQCSEAMETTSGGGLFALQAIVTREASDLGSRNQGCDDKAR